MSPEIASALRLLYGESGKAESELLRQLDPEGLKAAFRRRAMELHPDRARILGKNSDELSELFKDVQTAYQRLRELIGPAFGSTGKGLHGAGSAGDQSRTPGEHYWEADIPPVKLLFGQFLYYAGLITFGTMISAVAWQRRQRPTFGKIARNWKFLSSKDLKTLLSGSRKGEKLGETATRLGYMTPFQRDSVLGFQRWLQRPIGEFFQEIGILEEAEIVYLIGLMRKHNDRVERMMSF